MEYKLKKLDKSQIELEITVLVADYADDLQKAATKLSEVASIKGFRPGKAPYEKVKQQLGELKIMQEAMQMIVEQNYAKAVKKEKVDTIGMPQISIEKMAPGNDFVFKATVALMPKITLVDVEKVKAEKKKINIDDKKLNETLEHLKKMQATEVIKKGKSTKKDKVTIDMDMSINKVIVEGGSAKNHGVYLSEKHYIPGLDEQLSDLKKGDSKEFTLKFPKEHYQKNLAGKDVDFKIKVNEVFEIKHPEINDEFAKTLGMESVEKLKQTLKENLQKEEEKKEDQRIEIEIFDQIVEQSKFDEIPEVLLNHEKEKMFHELKHQLQRQGIEIEDYLKNIKKTEQQIFEDFAIQADKRVRAALASRQIALDNNINATKEEIDKEIELIKKTYPGDQNVEDNLKRPDVLDSLASAVQNRKVVKYLKEKVLKQ